MKPNDYFDMMQEVTTRWPEADPEVLKILLEASSLHNRKNNDYDGTSELTNMLGIEGDFGNVWKKVARLFSIIIKKKKPMVAESLDETVLDLIVHAAMLLSKIRKGVTE